MRGSTGRPPPARPALGMGPQPGLCRDRAPSGPPGSQRPPGPERWLRPPCQHRLWVSGSPAVDRRGGLHGERVCVWGAVRRPGVGEAEGALSPGAPARSIPGPRPPSVPRWRDALLSLCRRSVRLGVAAWVGVLPALHLCAGPRPPARPPGTQPEEAWAGLEGIAFLEFRRRRALT